MAEATVGTNVDPVEVAQFERLANTWWDPDGPFWPLHGLNALRTAYLRQAICEHFGRDAEAPQPLDGVKVIDIGCGGGLLSESFARLGATVRGIDVVEKNLHIAQGHARDTGLDVEYRHTTSTACVEQGETYDVVLNMEVVEHVPDPASLIRECAQLCKPGGFVCIATINRTVKSWVFAKSALNTYFACYRKARISGASSSPHWKLRPNWSTTGVSWLKNAACGLTHSRDVSPWHPRCR